MDTIRILRRGPGHPRKRSGRAMGGNNRETTSGPAEPQISGASVAATRPQYAAATAVTPAEIRVCVGAVRRPE